MAEPMMVDGKEEDENDDAIKNKIIIFIFFGIPNPHIFCLD